MRRRLHLIVIPAAALLAVLPLILNGCSCGHDLDFHLLSWLEAAQQFSTGNLHPHWAYTPAYGAGEPRFVFYPPLSWTIGALLTLGLSHLHIENAFAIAPILFTWIALAAAGLTMHALARRYTSPTAALLAATLYLGNPYTLFTAFERTAFAELLAAAWIPLLLLAILPPPRLAVGATPDPPISVPLLALAVALLWLTNAPAAVMGCYALTLIAAIRLVALFRQTRRLRPLLAPAARIVAGTGLGLGLAAFYILPAAFEQRWVEIAMAIIPGMRISDNTLFHHTSDPEHDAVLHTASLLAVLLLSLTALALLVARRSPSSRPPPHRAPGLLPTLAILMAVIALLLTPLAAPVWRHAPELAFLQFPWRTLAILVAILALAIALALRPLHLRPPLAITAALLLPSALTFAAWQHFHQPCDPEDTPAAQLALFHSPTGADPTDEYTPVTADNDALHHDNPTLQLQPPRTAPASPLPMHGPAPSHLDLNLSQPETLTLNLRDYPAWQITRNGLPLTDRLQRDDGLLSVPLPAGPSQIDITYVTTPDSEAGDLISIAALCTVAALLVPRRKLLAR